MKSRRNSINMSLTKSSQKKRSPIKGMMRMGLPQQTSLPRKVITNNNQRFLKRNRKKDDNEETKEKEPIIVEPEALKSLPEKSKQYAIPSLPRFKGSISEGFEQYMKPYIDMEEKEIKDNIYDAFNNNDDYDPHSE
mmetsp:Transcript_38374/g.34184  ORF Transcript_38374/g.34184 Transcript_38374/m.34184 type:complete len:136 (-) Transcript_38374:13-420(-)